MRAALLAICFAIGILMAAILLVDVVNAKEPTTLEDALERPVKVKKYVDKANNVVCYWQEGSQYLTCLQRRGLRQHNSDVK